MTGEPSPIETEALDVSKGTYRLAKWGFWIALGGAVFVAVQVQEMGDQTIILGSQTISAAAGAAIGELNTRQQLSIAQMQAKAAQDSVEAIQRQTRIDQRPWIKINTIVDRVVSVDFAPTHALEGNFNMTNIGKTPAKNVYAKVVIRPVNGLLPPMTDNLKGKSEEPHRFIRAGTLFPNDKTGDIPVVRGRRAEDGSIEIVPISYPESDDLMTGKSVTVIYGKVTYDDVFSIHHWTYFCAYTSPPNIDESLAEYGAVVAKCGAYNRIDKNN